MSKKRTKGKKKARSGSRSLPVPTFDRRVMEQLMRDLGHLLEGHEFKSIEEANAFLQQVVASGGPTPATDLTPLERAQDLMYEAWEATGKRRVKLARQALQISEDCADAYVLLAEEAAGSLHEAQALYEQGIKAGERALGPEMFEEDVGHFWGVLETRPYMRARTGLAQCLWLLGKNEEAIAHYQDMLRLNLNDNQGIRYILANCLLEDGRDEELGALLQQYKDDAAATWAYSRALWWFRDEGTGDSANRALQEALRTNPYVPAYLLGHKSLPRQLPPYVGLGDESEAVEYAAHALGVWHMTEGALAWLASHVKEQPGS